MLSIEAELAFHREKRAFVYNFASARFEVLCQTGHPGPTLAHSMRPEAMPY